MFSKLEHSHKCATLTTGCYAVFDYDAASGAFKPGHTAGTPPQGNDAKCGFACHTAAKSRDYVFTEYGQR
jgi:hypothetical protein